MSLLNLGIDPEILLVYLHYFLHFYFYIFNFFGALQGSLSGLFWLIGVIIAQWGVGFFLVRTFFERSTRNMHNKYSKLIKEGMKAQDAYNKLKGNLVLERGGLKKELGLILKICVHCFYSLMIIVSSLNLACLL